MSVWLKLTAGRYLCVRSGSWKRLARARADKTSSFMAKAINITVMSCKHVALLCLTPQQREAEVFQSEYSWLKMKVSQAAAWNDKEKCHREQQSPSTSRSHSTETKNKRTLPGN